MIDSEHVHHTKTKRNEHDWNEIRISSTGSAGSEQDFFQLLQCHLQPRIMDGLEDTHLFCIIIAGH